MLGSPNHFKKPPQQKTFIMNIEHATFLIGKLILGGFFILSGLKHFTQNREMTEWLKTKKLPIPRTSVYISGLTLITAGTGITIGAFPVLSITLLSAFLITANITMHDYWNLEENRQQQKNQFMKNAALLGALLMLIGADWTIYGLGLTLNLL